MVSRGDIESKGSNKSISTYLVLHTKKKEGEEIIKADGLVPMYGMSLVGFLYIRGFS